MWWDDFLVVSEVITACDVYHGPFFWASSQPLFHGIVANTIACLCWCYHQQKKQTNPPFLGLIKLKTPYPIPFRRISIISFFVLIQRKEPKKNQGKPDRSARFAKPRANFCFNPNTSCIAAVQSVFDFVSVFANNPAWLYNIRIYSINYIEEWLS